MTDDYVQPIPTQCAMCLKTPETRVKSQPPYVTDSRRRQLKWLWVCKLHGDELVGQGYEPMETLF